MLVNVKPAALVINVVYKLMEVSYPIEKLKIPENIWQIILPLAESLAYRLPVRQV